MPNAEFGLQNKEEQPSIGGDAIAVGPFHSHLLKSYEPIDSDFSNFWNTFLGTSSYTHALKVLKTTSIFFDLGSYPNA